MITPVRIQLSRQKGFKLQEYSRSINGLPAIKIDRTTKWGNPLILLGDIIYVNANYRRHIFDKWVFLMTGNLEEMLKIYHKLWTDTGFYNQDLQYWCNKFKGMDLNELKNHNLACWCKTDNKLCHGEILLKLIQNLK